MPLLSRKADYALLILSYLHRHTEGGCARAIATQFRLSRGFVANILKELCQKGFVVSHRGVRGGYSLARPAEAIRLLDVLTALEEGFQLTTCTRSRHDSNEAACDLESICPIVEPMRQIHQRIFSILHDVTLHDLFAVDRPSVVPPPVLRSLPLPVNVLATVPPLIE